MSVLTAPLLRLKLPQNTKGEAKRKCHHAPGPCVVSGKDLHGVMDDGRAGCTVLWILDSVYQLGASLAARLNYVYKGTSLIHFAVLRIPYIHSISYGDGTMNHDRR